MWLSIVVVFSLFSTTISFSFEKSEKISDFENVIENILDTYKIKNILIFASEEILRDDYENFIFAKTDKTTKIINTKFISYIRNFYRSTKTPETIEEKKSYNAQLQHMGEIQKRKELRYHVDSDRFLSVVFFNNLNCTILEKVFRLLEGKRAMRIVFVRINDKEDWNKDQIKEFFDWVIAKRMTNSVLLLKNEQNQTEVHRHNPFLETGVTLLTHLPVKIWFNEIHLEKISGLQLKAFYYPEVIRSHIYPGKKIAVENLSGHLGHTFKEFIKYVNAIVEFPKIGVPLSIAIENEMVVKCNQHSRYVSMMPHAVIQ